MTPSRRHFLAGLAALGAVRPTRAADNPIKLGVIGCGWWGMVDLKPAFAQNSVQVVALCDADSEHLAGYQTEIGKMQSNMPKSYKHFEEMLDHPGLEAVLLATPPHWHALPFLAACRKGLAIYCEKPLAYDVREGQAMVEAQKKAGNIVQIGFQRRQSQAFQKTRDYLASGKPGKLVQVDAQIHYQAGTPDPKPVDPPSTLDWDLWCGPAPKLPYSVAIGHRSWRLEKAYGNGHLVDWGIHLIDATRFILGESTPKWVQAAGGLYHYEGKITTPDTLTAHFEFERCPVVWRHRLWGSAEFSPETNNGIFLYCESETIFANDQSWTVIPKGKGEPRRTERLQTDLTGEHWAAFVRAVREKKPVAVTVEEGWKSTTAVHLAMASYNTGSRVAWDPGKAAVAGNGKAAAELKRAYRKPYKHPWAG